MKPLTLGALVMEAAIRVAPSDVSLVLLHEIDALRAAMAVADDAGARHERNRCAAIVSAAADRARASNRKKAAAELDMLARDIVDYREVSP